MKGHEMIQFTIQLNTREGIDPLYSRKQASWPVLPREGEYVMLDSGDATHGDEEFFPVVDIWHYIQFGLPCICVEIELDPNSFKRFVEHPDWTHSMRDVRQALP